MFEYAFMNHAFIAGMVLGAAIPCIGVIVVLKRLSMMGSTPSRSKPPLRAQSCKSSVFPW